MTDYRRVVIRGSRFVVVRALADVGIPFAFGHEAGPNTVGLVGGQHIPALSAFLDAHPEFEGRYAAHERSAS